MTSENQNKTIALAGMHQALLQIQNIAWEDKRSFDQIDVCLSSLFIRDPNTYIEVYGQIENIQEGLKALRASFKNKHDKQALERARYMVGLMILSKKFNKFSGLDEQIRTTLSLLDDAAQDLENQRDYIIERIAQLYQNTLSKISPRIIIYGKPEILNNNENAALIRSLLLAGLRSAMLWYQAGGSQLNLLLGKSKYLQNIEQLLD